MKFLFVEQWKKHGALTQITTLIQNIVYFNRLMCFSNFAAALAKAFWALTTVIVTYLLVYTRSIL